MNEPPSSPGGPANVWEWVSASESETARFGSALAECLTPGSIVALVGELGAGKTRLVQGIAAGLGADRRLVNSPTFILIQEYAGRLPIYHFDTYRLGSVEEFLELGSPEYLAGAGVCLIEWADRVTAALPADRLTIAIEFAGTEARRFAVTAGGPQSQACLERLRRVV